MQTYIFLTDEGLKLRTIALETLTMVNLHFQLSL